MQAKSGNEKTLNEKTIVKPISVQGTRAVGIQKHETVPTREWHNSFPINVGIVFVVSVL